MVYAGSEGMAPTLIVGCWSSQQPSPGISYSVIIFLLYLQEGINSVGSEDYLIVINYLPIYCTIRTGLKGFIRLVDIEDPSFSV